jgi:hypothetical protein
MKLRGKVGRTIFMVTDPARKETWRERPADFLESWQVRKMSTRPELIRQFAHYLAAYEKMESGAAVEVRVDSKVRLNSRPSEVLIDPAVDLAKEPYRIGPARWITRGSSQR